MRNVFALLLIAGVALADTRVTVTADATLPTTTSASQTDKSTAINATTLCTPAADGFFRISVYLKITTTGTSPVAGPITITYTDAVGSAAQSHVLALINTSGAVVTTTVNNSVTTGTVFGSMVVNAKAAVAIQYAVAVSGTYGTGRYAIQLRCEAV